MFNPTRDEARRFMIDAWRKYRENLPLTPLETIFAELAVEHPEYHPILEDADAMDRDFTPEDGQINPFLHLSLHLAIHEQLSIDQPPGLREAYDLCLARHHGDRHAALHDVLECLGETIYNAQKNKAPLDAQAYVECVRRRA
ncbi:DUF1841 family protein [Uliginosibacterium sp. sgz301328]|uniref:DUF1841 family protein n=1 Tax=Uliginosibacterium sp. sgz301328 TaxID=3243764 RepID=UPI00359DA2F9